MSVDAREATDSTLAKTAVKHADTFMACGIFLEPVDASVRAVVSPTSGPSLDRLLDQTWAITEQL